MKNTPTAKGIGAGAWLVNTGDAIFGAKGNKTGDFYKYDVANDTWTTKLSWPAGTENKLPTKGSAACFDGDHYIYAVKANNTQAFWRYDVTANTWTRMAKDVPLGASNKKVKEGAGMAFVTKGGANYVYLLKGYKTELWAYDIAHDSWLPKRNSPVAIQKYKNGSWLATDGEEDGNLYAAQATYQEFWRYNVGTDSWNKKLAAYPLVYKINNPNNRSKKLKGGGCGAYDANYIYSLKGGNTLQFFRYDVANDSWTSKESMPAKASYGLKNVKVKDGGAIVAYDGKFYAFKGGKTYEFWRYTPGSLVFAVNRPSRDGAVTSSIFDVTKSTFAVAPNPLVSGYATLSYNLPKAGPMAVTVHDVTGRTVMTKTVAAGRTGSVALDLRSLNAGVYLVKLSTDGCTASQKLVVQH